MSPIKLFILNYLNTLSLQLARIYSSVWVLKMFPQSCTFHYPSLEQSHLTKLFNSLADRSTRPSDSSIENESFVLTYSQRFSKMPEDGVAVAPSGMDKHAKLAAGRPMTEVPEGAGDHRTLEKLAKVLKNKNNLILDFKENEK